MNVVVEIRKSLFRGTILLSDHTLKRMQQRGYHKGDLIRCIMSGHLIERQVSSHRQYRYVVQGVDDSNNPIVCVFQKEGKGFRVITVMPPYDRHRFDSVI